MIKKELKEVAALEKEYMFVSISGLEDKEKAKLKAKINKWKTTQEDFAWAKNYLEAKGSNNTDMQNLKRQFESLNYFKQLIQKLKTS